MTVSTELSPYFAGQYVALILDNEVTVEHFVTTPPLPWIRLVDQGDGYRVSDGYPRLLTAEEARREMRNWDLVSEPRVIQTLKNLGEEVDTVVIGNNAGQGLPLAESLPKERRGTKAAIIYARSLPEIKEYKAAGYTTFIRRAGLVSHVNGLAQAAGRPLALAFINTIQHNASNYHDP
jgi:hypothetical protein